jgi:hypothetical protein
LGCGLDVATARNVEVASNIEISTVIVVVGLLDNVSFYVLKVI